MELVSDQQFLTSLYTQKKSTIQSTVSIMKKFNLRGFPKLTSETIKYDYETEVE